MRILWLAPYPLQAVAEALATPKPLPFGTCHWLVHLAHALAQTKRVELHVLTYSHLVEKDQTVHHQGVTFHVLRYAFPLLGKGPSLFCFDRLTGYRTLLPAIERTIRAVGPDLIHAHGTEGAYSLAALRSGLPSLTSIQGLIHEIYRVEPGLGFRLQLPIERACLRGNTQFGCRTAWDTAMVRAANPAAQIHYLPEAINPVYFRTPRQPVSPPTVTFVGGLVERKGIGVLLGAMPLVVKQLPHVQFLIIGTGPPRYVRALQRQAAQQGLTERITWLGTQPPPAIAATLARSSVYVLPTFMDNSPNSLCEAMAMGLPVVSTTVGGVPSLIEPQQTGLLVPPNDAPRLAAALCHVLTEEPLATHLGQQARRVATQRHLPATVAQLTLQAYQTIVTPTVVAPAPFRPHHQTPAGL